MRASPLLTTTASSRIRATLIVSTIDLSKLDVGGISGDQTVAP
jgi:hypothetical protein